jgi:hypothetical protein
VQVSADILLFPLTVTGASLFITWPEFDGIAEYRLKHTGHDISSTPHQLRMLENE